MNEITPKFQVSEIVKCVESASYFINKYIKIYDATAQQWIPFELWPEQEDVLAVLERERQIVILKARQLGMTWLVLAYILHRMLFDPVYSSIIYSRRDAESIYLLDERTRGMFERIPEWLIHGVAPEIGGDNKHTMILNSGSSARAFSPTVGDSYTASVVVIDEADLVPDLDKLLRAVKPAIDNGGQLILLSRSNKDKPISTFKRIYTSAKSGKNSYVAVFLPWHVHPGRDADWYERQKRDALEHDGVLDVVFEQYPATDAEALRAATKGKRLNIDHLESCFAEADLVESAVVEQLEILLPGVEIRVYRLPEQKRAYVIGCDPAEGVPGGDDSAVSVLDAVTGEECANVAGIYDITTTGVIVATFSAMYNMAPALIERNNHGHAVILWLMDHTNVPLFCDLDERPGWRETDRSKTLLYDSFAEAIRFHYAIIHDFGTFQQLASIDSKTLRAPEGMHDDMSVSFVLGYMATTMAYEPNQTEERGYHEHASFGY